MAMRMEKRLMALEPSMREIKLLEYQRLDFMPEAERRIYLRNELDTKRDEVRCRIRARAGWLAQC
jgi:hypothetical protein